MPGDSKNTDPKSVWRDQETGDPSITIEWLRKRARELHQKQRVELLSGLLLAVGCAAVSIWGLRLANAPDVLDRALRLVFVAVMFWAVAGQFVLRRRHWSQSLPGDAGLNTGLDFYRRQLKQHRKLFGRTVEWSIAPLVLAIVALIVKLIRVAEASGVSIIRVVPFYGLFALWLLAVSVQRWRRNKDLRREMADLDRIGKAP